ncbi:monovalent cation/H+ antiporter complex subunit F [Glutamicibacter uratoxydans]|uniref:monovalent cation/H+ antiporter complex subunit F n=1 Tax=Glutamicibacter uratoxydans TaxID=43667 RepID=UPI003D6FD353
MTFIVVGIAGALLSIGAVACLIRVARGPSILDRVLALDVMLLIISAALCLEMYLNEHRNNILFVVIACAIAFIGSVTVSRFVSDQRNA